MKRLHPFTHFLFGVLILALTTYRLVAAENEGLANFSPLLALVFCGAVYFRCSLMWLVPFGVLMISEGILNTYYGLDWNTLDFLVRLLCFSGALGLGLLVAQRRSWLSLAGGCLAGSIIFYFGTNSLCWLQEPSYAKSFAGWWQCMTLGLPGFPPTWVFFRNSLLSDFIFTGIFAAVMEGVLAAAGQRSLLVSSQKVAVKTN